MYKLALLKSKNGYIDQLVLAKRTVEGYFKKSFRAASLFKRQPWKNKFLAFVHLFSDISQQNIVAISEIFEDVAREGTFKKQT